MNRIKVKKVTQNQKKDDIRACHPHELEEYVRKQNGGGKHPRKTLPERFDEATHDMRRLARDTINYQRFKLEEQIQAAASSEIAQSLRELEHELGRQFAAVVNGGVRGTIVAINALRVFGPPPVGSDLA